MVQTLSFVQRELNPKISEIISKAMEMDLTRFVIGFIALLLSLILVLLHHVKKKNKKRLPPGPLGWPVFGYMFSLGAMPHHTLAALKQQYGPVVWFKLASVNTMAILDAKAAAEFFKNHDLSFADSSVFDNTRSHGFNTSAVVMSPHGTYWRVIKRIYTVQLLTAKRINETAPIREKCVQDMLGWIKKECGVDGNIGIYVGKFVFLGVFNMLGNLVVSRDLVDPQSTVGSEFFDAVMGISETAGLVNLSDLFPWLRPFDLQGVRRTMDRHMGKALDIISGYVKERHQGGSVDRTKKDFLDVLLDFEGFENGDPITLSDNNINVLILEIFFAGAESTSSTVEWALAELLNNPAKMKIAKSEVTKVVGANNKFQESDIDNLPYLQAIVKETLRLHPTAPFLVPRRATQDVTNFMGYEIPKDTQVLVNVWAIGRDPEYWDHPLCFEPERFLGLNSTTDFRGQNFELIPLGAGRICPAVPLAQRMIPLILGSLLHEFDWKLENNVTGKGMDMREKMSVLLKKLEPLKAIPI